MESDGGLYNAKFRIISAKAVYQMVAGNEYIEYSERCLLDNFIF